MVENKNTDKDIDKNVRKRGVKALGPSVFVAILCIFLSVADIVLLRDAFEKISGITGPEVIVLVLVFTALADFFAFEWGKKTGENMESNLINKKAIIFFLLWVGMGIMFIVIRTIYLIILNQEAIDDGVEPTEVMQILFGNLVMIIVLALLYIGTGLSIATCFRNVFDADSARYRAAKRNFENAHNDCANKIAQMQEMIGVLKPYGEYYASLKKQKNGLNDMIYNFEESVMDTIIGKVEKDHGHIDPKKADQIKKEVRSERKSHVYEEK